MSHLFYIRELCSCILPLSARLRLNHVIRRAAISEFIESKILKYKLSPYDIKQYCESCACVGWLFSGRSTEGKIMITGIIKREGYTLEPEPIMQMLCVNDKFGDAIQRSEGRAGHQYEDAGDYGYNCCIYKSNASYIINGIGCWNRYLKATVSGIKPTVYLSEPNYVKQPKIVYDTLSTWFMFRQSEYLNLTGVDYPNEYEVNKLITKRIKKDLLELEDYEKSAIATVNSKVIGVHVDSDTPLDPTFDWLDQLCV